MQKIADNYPDIAANLARIESEKQERLNRPEPVEQPAVDWNYKIITDEWAGYGPAGG